MLQWLKDFFYPRKCPFCGGVVEEDHKICGRCTLPESHDFYMVGSGLWCYSPYWYENKVKKAIKRYKFSGLYQYSTCFGRLMAVIPLGGEPFDFVTWVPLAAARLKKRGYDQAELLAVEVARVYGLPLQNTLVKTKNNKPQSSLDEGEARFENAKDAYILADTSVLGANILLIDDVITSGASILSCYDTLMAGGANSVSCMSLARGKRTRNYRHYSR